MLAPRVKKEIYNSSYFSAVVAALDEIERQADLWNKNESNRKLTHCKRPADVKKAMKDGDIALIHSVEGAHSLQTTCAKDYPNDIGVE